MASIAAVDVLFHICGDYISIIRQLKQQGPLRGIFRGRRYLRAKAIQQYIAKPGSERPVRTTRVTFAADLFLKSPHRKRADAQADSHVSTASPVSKAMACAQPAPL